MRASPRRELATMVRGRPAGTVSSVDRPLVIAPDPDQSGDWSSPREREGLTDDKRDPALLCAVRPKVAECHKGPGGREPRMDTSCPNEVAAARARGVATRVRVKRRPYPFASPGCCADEVWVVGLSYGDALRAGSPRQSVLGSKAALRFFGQHSSSMGDANF